MNSLQRRKALVEVETYLEGCKTKQQIDRGIAMLLEIEQKHIDYLTELMEEVSPDYIPMELQ